MKNSELKKIVARLAKIHKDPRTGLREHFATVELDNGVIRGRVPSYQYEAPFPCVTGEREVRCHVNFFDIERIVKKIPASKEIRFVYNEALCNVEIDGKHKFTINGEFVDNNKLELENYSGEFVAKVAPAQLDDLFSFCTKDELRVSMTGIYFDAESRYMVATDAHRLKRISNDIRSSFIMPNLTGLLYGDSAYIYRLHNDSQYTHKVVINSSYTLYFRAIDARYVDWKVVFPTYEKTNFVVENTKLKNILSESLIAADENNKGILFFNSGVVKLHTSSGNLGYTEEVAETFSNMLPEYGKIGFNIDYLKRSLPNVDKVSFKFGDAPNRVIVINNDILLMPLMLNE